ncbi:hypothetical protein D3C86_2159250 [compost metagenome]
MQDEARINGRIFRRHALNRFIHGKMNIVGHVLCEASAGRALVLKGFGLAVGASVAIVAWSSLERA